MIHTEDFAAVVEVVVAAQAAAEAQGRFHQ